MWLSFIINKHVFSLFCFKREHKKSVMHDCMSVRKKKRWRKKLLYEEDIRYLYLVKTRFEWDGGVEK